MTFELWHMNDMNDRGEGEGWILNQSFPDWLSLFEYGPDVAAWFRRNPNATYLAYDHGKGLHWKFIRKE